MTNKHTPFPWYKARNAIYALDESRVLNRMSFQIEGGYVYQSFNDQNSVRTSEEELQATVDFVYKAVTSFDKMKFAIQTAQSFIADGGLAETSPGFEIYRHLTDVLKEIQ